MAIPTKDMFERKTFTVSRLSEFATESELTKQVGHGAALWPLVVVKELVDNAIDAAENAGLASDVAVVVESDRIIVADQGQGIPAATVKALTDFGSKTSSNAAYCSPSCGQQGNALQSILAMPFVLDGKQGSVLIEAQGKAHDIGFSLDPVRQIPVVERAVSPSTVKNGTRITVRWPLSPRSPLEAVSNDFLRLVINYVWLNPHLSLEATWLGESYLDWSASDPDWRKWRPNYATSPHWYTPERLTRLMAGEIARAEDKRQPCPSVRDFVRQFAGLSSTVKASEISTALSVGDRETLADYYRRVPSPVALLAAMREASRPIKPKALGVLGEDHLKGTLAASGCAPESLVIRKAELEYADLPYVIETAFGYRLDDLGVQLREGFNFTPAIGVASPFQLNELLGRLQFEDEDSVTVFAHVVSPRLDFLDRGKARVNLPQPVRAKLNDMIVSVTSKWTRQKKAEIREHNARLKRRDAMVRRVKPTTVIDAAYSVMIDAYTTASDDGEGGHLPVKPRQIMYRARGRILAMTGKDAFDDNYFTQKILVWFMRDHPEETASWDIIWDDRGHFAEPHTDHEIGLGTLPVREYIAGFRAPEIRPIAVRGAHVSTFGPEGRYSAVLFIEKEGFEPIFQAAGLYERYDLAPMSTKGMSVTAARQLIEELCGVRGLPLFVLHDFDKSGFSIHETLINDTERYEFKTPLKRVVEIGLRLADVEELGLEPERVVIKANEKPAARENLRANGATEAEIAFLIDGDQRVELNSLTSRQLVDLVEDALIAHGVDKVIPDAQTLNEAFIAFKRSAATRAALEAELARLGAGVVEVPDDLEARVRAWLSAGDERRKLTWDAAVRAIVAGADEDPDADADDDDDDEQ